MYPSPSAATTNPPPQHHNHQPQPPPPRPRSPETFASLHTRNAAAQTLQSYERLSWHALNRNESLAQTRLHFLSVLAGFSADDEQAQIDWKTDTTPIAHPHEERSKGSVSKGKEKERTSLGGGSPAGKGKERSLGGGSPAGNGSGSGSGSGRKKRRSAGVGS